MNPQPIPRAVSEVARQWVTDPDSTRSQDAVYNLFARNLPRSNLPSSDKRGGILAHAARSLGHSDDMLECVEGRVIMDSVVRAAACLEKASYLPIQVQAILFHISSYLLFIR